MDEEQLMNDFQKNFEKLFLINTTPTGANPTLVRLANGIDTFEETNNETKETKMYYNNEGYGTTISTNKSMTWTASGDRIKGDPAQDFIAGLYFKLGGELETDYESYDSEGNKIAGDCSVTDIIKFGGGAGEISPFGATINGNGKPTITYATAAVDFTTPTVFAAGATEGTTKATITQAASGIEKDLTLYYTLGAAAVTKNTHQYVDTNTLTAYTSSAEIAAEKDQYLTIYGVDANKRVQRFISHKVLEAEIA
jgi:hypothetical protein